MGLDTFGEARVRFTEGGEDGEGEGARNAEGVNGEVKARGSLGKGKAERGGVPEGRRERGEEGGEVSELQLVFL